jgi:hypothetical protein
MMKPVSSGKFIYNKVKNGQVLPANPAEVPLPVIFCFLSAVNTLEHGDVARLVTESRDLVNNFWTDEKFVSEVYRL